MSACTSTSTSTSSYIPPVQVIETQVEKNEPNVLNSAESGEVNPTAIDATIPMRYPQLIERLLSLPAADREEQTVCIIGPSVIIPAKINDNRPTNSTTPPVTVDSDFRTSILIPQVHELSFCFPKSQFHLADIDPKILDIIKTCMEPHPPYNKIYPTGFAIHSLANDFKNGDTTYTKTIELLNQLRNTSGNKKKHSSDLNLRNFQFHEVDIAEKTVTVKKKCNYVFATNVLIYAAQKAEQKSPQERKEAMKALCKNVFQIVKVKGKIYIDQGSIKKICDVATITDDKFLDFIRESAGIRCNSKLLENQPAHKNGCVRLPLSREEIEKTVLAVPTGAIYEFTRTS